MNIDLKEFEHLEKESTYNYNVYKHKNANTSTLLLIKHTDDSNEVDLFVITASGEAFIGSSIDKGNGIFDFELGYNYT